MLGVLLWVAGREGTGLRGGQWEGWDRAGWGRSWRDEKGWDGWERVGWDTAGWGGAVG